MCSIIEMHSQYAQKFNHDAIADAYDNNIQDETNPIRKGYKDMMQWIGKKTGTSKYIIDLGCGTGNTTKQIKYYEKIYCVDISKNMLEIAKNKLAKKENIIFIESDLLNCLDNFQDKNKVDTIVSTYAIHHLTQKEKHIFFKKAFDILPNKGKIVFGDLMFQNKNYESIMKQKYPNLVKDFDDEVYWYIEDETKQLKEIGFTVEISQFSDLSWGIYGEK